MAAKRPAVLAALKTLLVNGVSAVNGRVYLPWEDLPESEKNNPVIQIEIEDSKIEQAGFNLWTHTVSINIGVIMSGKFDYQTTWDVLDSIMSTINSNRTLSGACESIDPEGGQDSITVNGDKILWPHIAVTIMYRTAKGAI